MSPVSVTLHDGTHMCMAMPMSLYKQRSASSAASQQKRTEPLPLGFAPVPMLPRPQLSRPTKSELTHRASKAAVRLRTRPSLLSEQAGVRTGEGEARLPATASCSPEMCPRPAVPAHEWRGGTGPSQQLPRAPASPGLCLAPAGRPMGFSRTQLVLNRGHF